jgi:hypothetical protein
LLGANEPARWIENALLRWRVGIAPDFGLFGGLGKLPLLTLVEVPFKLLCLSTVLLN